MWKQSEQSKTDSEGSKINAFHDRKKNHIIYRKRNTIKS